MLFKKDKVGSAAVPKKDSVDSKSSKKSKEQSKSNIGFNSREKEEDMPTWAIWVMCGVGVAVVVGLIVIGCIYFPAEVLFILKMPNIIIH